MKPFGFTQRDDDLVVLKKFNQALEAHSLRILLEASGIQAVVAGEEANSLIGLPLLPAGVLGVGVEVSVRREDVESAKLVMTQVPAASEVLIPEWKCSCGELVDRGFSVCWSCGSEFEEDSVGTDSSQVGGTNDSTESDASDAQSSRDADLQEFERLRQSASSRRRGPVPSLLLGIGLVGMIVAYFLPLDFAAYGVFVFLAGALACVTGALRLAMARDNERLDDSV